MTSPDFESIAENAPDRRRRRRSVSLKGYIIRSGGLSHPIELVDLNYGGCGISTATELRPGEVVKLTVLGRGSIPAEIRWFNDGCAGLDFTMSIKAGRKQAPRRTVRVPVSAEVSLRARGRNTYRVAIFDLSTDGCQVELVERPGVGDRMSVKFDNLDVLEADVCWVEGHRAGLMFQKRMHPAVLDLLLLRLGQASSSARTTLSELFCSPTFPMLYNPLTAPDLATVMIPPAVCHLNRNLIIRRDKVPAQHRNFVLIEYDEPIAFHGSASFVFCGSRPFRSETRATKPPHWPGDYATGGNPHRSYSIPLRRMRQRFGAPRRKPRCDSTTTRAVGRPAPCRPFSNDSSTLRSLVNRAHAKRRADREPTHTHKPNNGSHSRSPVRTPALRSSC